METAPAQAVSIQTQIYLVGYTSIPAYVLLYYDYLLTLGDEVQFFWSKKQFTFMTAVFFLSRYTSVLGHIPVLFGRCYQLLKYHQYLAGVIQIIAGIVMSCRVYALYERKRWVLFSLAAAGLAIVGFGIWSLHDMSWEVNLTQPLIETGCLLPLSKRDAAYYAGAWSGALAFDAVVFALTVYKSITRQWEQDATLLFVLLRDGSVYFGIMALLTLSVILSLHLSLDYNRGVTASMTNVLSSIMISRLMINLRDPHLAEKTFRHRTLTMLMHTSFSEDDLSECITDGQTFLQQMDGTRSQVMLLHPRARTPSDVTDATLVQSLHGNEGDPNKYQRKILESF